MNESKLQAEIIKWLKSQGAYVIKTRPQPGIPVGCPDIIALYEGAWLAIEVKTAINSKFQQGQKYTLALLGEWSPFVYIVYPQNWLTIKAELATNFF